MTALVLVTGPPRAGTTAMVAALRGRLPERSTAEWRVAERDDRSPPTRPAATVFVVSAVTPMTGSDIALLDTAAAEADVVVAVVSKIDDHREWRRTLADNRRLAADASIADVPWVGAAAAPRLGEPVLDELIDCLDASLRDPVSRARKRQRAKDVRIDQLHAERAELRRRSRVAAAQRASEVRDTGRQMRSSVAHDVRSRCAALRTELATEVATVSRSDVAGFVDRARDRCAEVLADIADAIADAIAGDIARDTGLQNPRMGAEVPGPESAGIPDLPPRSRRLENRLVAALGAGFGVGVAMVVLRVVTGLAPGWAAAGHVAGCAAGLATAVWMIRTRALLADRAQLQMWVSEAAAAVRRAADGMAGAAVAAAESARDAQHAIEAAARDADTVRAIAAIDLEIRRLTRERNPPNVLPVGRTAGDAHLNRSCE